MRGLTGLLVVVAVALTATPGSAVTGYHVYLTGGQGLYVRGGPTQSFSPVGFLPEGTPVDIDCQMRGQNINGSRIWDRLQGPFVGYVSDYYINTPVFGDFSPGLPHCTETTMRNETLAFRNTYVFDPGPGVVISYAQFASPAFVSFYGGRGYDRNFMVWAPIATFQAPNTSWAACNTATQSHTGAFCPTGIINVPIGDPIPDRIITAKTWNGSFIGVVCGNYNNGTPGPMPVVSGTKYFDRNANGRRDAGEPGLPGWTMVLSYNGASVASTVTDANGNYSFALNANTMPVGAGTYSVSEVTRAGYVQTAAPSSVFVPFGAANAVYAGLDFGNAAAMWGRAVGLVQSVLPPPVPSTIADTGPVVKIASATVRQTAIDVPANPVIEGSGLASTVTTIAGGDVTAEADVAELTILAGGHVIIARGIRAKSHTSCIDPGSGGTSIGFLSVDGTPVINQDPQPGSPIAIPGVGTLLLNNQGLEDGASDGLPGRVFAVDALDLVLDNAGDIIVARASTGSGCVP